MAASTDLPPGNTALSLVGAGVADDLSFVDVRLQMQGSGHLTLRLPAPSLAQITSKLNELNLFVETRNATSTGHLAVSASEAIDVTAGASAEGSKVVLAIKGLNKNAYHFAIPIDVAERFVPEFGKAIVDAKDRAKATRQ